MGVGKRASEGAESEVFGPRWHYSILGLKLGKPLPMLLALLLPRSSKLGRVERRRRSRDLAGG